jgi:hypothetical protein
MSLTVSLFYGSSRIVEYAISTVGELTEGLANQRVTVLVSAVGLSQVSTYMLSNNRGTNAPPPCGVSITGESMTVNKDLKITLSAGTGQELGLQDVDFATRRYIGLKQVLVELIDDA